MDLTEFDALWQKYAPWCTRVLKVCAAIGTFLTLIYFVRIRNMPLDSLQSLVGLAGAVMLVSLGLFVGTSIYWGFPGLVLRFWVEGADATVSTWLLNAPAVSPSAKSLARSPSFRRIAAWCIATVGAPWVLLLTYAEPEFFGGVGVIGYIQVPVLLVAMVVLGAYIFQSPSLDRIPALQMGPHPRLSKWDRIGTRLLVCASFVFANVFPLLIFFQLLSASDFAQESLPWHVLTLLAVAAAFTIVVNVFAVALVVLRDDNVTRRRFAHPLLVAGSVVLGITWLGAWAQLLDRVMIAVSVRVPNAVLLVNKSSCQPLEMVGLKAVAPASAASNAERGCVIRGVTVLSRVGARWPLECKSGTHAVANPVIKGDDVPVLLTEGEKPLSVMDSSDEVHLCVANGPAAVEKKAP